MGQGPHRRPARRDRHAGFGRARRRVQDDHERRVDRGTGQGCRGRFGRGTWRRRRTDERGRDAVRRAARDRRCAIGGCAGIKPDDRGECVASSSPGRRRCIGYCRGIGNGSCVGYCGCIGNGRCVGNGRRIDAGHGGRDHGNTGIRGSLRRFRNSGVRVGTGLVTGLAIGLGNGVGIGIGRDVGIRRDVRPAGHSGRNASVFGGPRRRGARGIARRRHG